jgi:hypothetical protein
VAIEVAKDHLLSKDMKHMLKAPTRLDFFEKGEYVLVEQGSSFRRGPDDKLLPFLAGPYVVVSNTGSEYELRNCVTQKLKTVHLSNLTAYRVGEYQRTPAEAALRDLNDVFLVDKVVSGVVENDLKGPVSLLKFRVSWVGFPGEDTVEGWKEVRNLEQLREFLKGHSNKEYRELVKRLPKGNRGVEEIESTDGLESKPKKIKKRRKDIKQVESEGESANFEGMEIVDGSEEKEKSDTVGSKQEVFKSERTTSKKRNWKSGVIVRKSGRVTRKSIRLMRGEEEG